MLKGGVALRDSTLRHAEELSQRRWWALEGHLPVYEAEGRLEAIGRQDPDRVEEVPMSEERAASRRSMSGSRSSQAARSARAVGVSTISAVLKACSMLVHIIFVHVRLIKPIKICLTWRTWFSYERDCPRRGARALMASGRRSLRLQLTVIVVYLHSDL